MKIIFLDAATLGSDADYARLRTFGELVLYGNSDASEAAGRIQDADVVITNKVPLNSSNLAGAHRLRLVCVAATGYNMLDIDALKERGIAVCNVSGYSTPGVAQHTFAMLFYLLHSLRNYDDFVRSGNYSVSGMFTCLEWPFHELDGKKWGIIGMGAIGRQVAQIAAAFGCELSYYSASGNNYDVPYRRLELKELLESSDIITIHTPLNDKTRGLVGAEQLRQMKPSAYLVNVGRGGIVDECALAEAVNKKIIAGAATDVMTTEPLPADTPLLRATGSGRLLVTPHIAWAAVESRARLLEGICDNIAAFVQGGCLNRVV